MKIMLASLPACLCLTALDVVGLNANSAVAQERRSDDRRSEDRRSDDDDDRDESGDRRRGDWRSWRRDRSDRDRDSDDRKSETSGRDENSDREASDRQSDESSSMTPDSWAKGLVDKHDKNGNKVLDGDERSSLTGPARTADFNKDGFISREEIAASLAKTTSDAPDSKSTSPAPAKESPERDNDKNRESGSDQTKSGSKPATTSTSKRVLTWLGGGKPGDDGKNSRRTYRFTPARDRLPSELPSWFKSQDKNGDGQVAMSEYSRSWTKSTVAKFQSYDADGDGIVTAKEAKGKK
jgi:hypothetical protein